MKKLRLQLGIGLFAVIAAAVPQSLSLAQTIAGATAPQAPGAPITVSLDEAINRAQKNDPAYAANAADLGSAKLEHSISRSALLPAATFHSEYLYTQPNGLRNQAGQTGSQLAPRFIANNAIREYASLAMVSESLSAAGVLNVSHAKAVAAKASADLEIARRDLAVKVVGDYFALEAAEDRLRVAQNAKDEAAAFTGLTQKLEAGREVAHADVVKADLQLQQRQREFEDAQLATERARLELATLLFPDPTTAYQLADSDKAPVPLPSESDVQAAASKDNPDLRSALDALKAAHTEVSAARAAYLPSLSLNYTYGIDAPQFAVNGPGEVRNLGYSAFVSLDIPVWDWFATHDRVKESQLHENTAKTVLTFTQKQLIAQLKEFYAEAQTANSQLTSLQDSVRTAQESLRLTKLRYSAGEATALEVVDAESMLTQTAVALSDGELRYRIALANLQTLTGSLYQP